MAPSRTRLPVHLLLLFLSLLKVHEAWRALSHDVVILDFACGGTQSVLAVAGSNDLLVIGQGTFGQFVVIK